MATLDQLAEDGKLLKYEADLEATQMPERYVYLSPDLAAWIGAVLPLEPCDLSVDLSPLEQVEERLYQFVIGRPLAYGSAFRPLQPVLRYWWELKTADVRIFGWFHRPRTFVGTCACMKRDVPNFRSYEPFCQRTILFREQLDLDEPRAVKRVGYADVF